jgi:hypothetical protein
MLDEGCDGVCGDCNGWCSVLGEVVKAAVLVGAVELFVVAMVVVVEVVVVAVAVVALLLLEYESGADW